MRLQNTRALGAAEEERAYIRNEARTLVRRNAELVDQGEIANKVREFESRIDVALHYNIPYPRLTNVVHGSTGAAPETVMPVYMHSYDEHAGTGRIPQRAPVYEDK